MVPKPQPAFLLSVSLLISGYSEIVQGSQHHVLMVSKEHLDVWSIHDLAQYPYSVREPVNHIAKYIECVIRREIQFFHQIVKSDLVPVYVRHYIDHCLSPSFRGQFLTNCFNAPEKASRVPFPLRRSLAVFRSKPQGVSVLASLFSRKSGQTCEWVKPPSAFKKLTVIGRPIFGLHLCRMKGAVVAMGTPGAIVFAKQRIDQAAPA